MKARAVAVTRRGRWALSFADLCLLLLGFFVLLHANAGRQQEIVGGVAEQFGAPAGKSEQFAAAALFQPGEALLSDAGKVQIAALGKRYAKGRQVLEIRSVGLDRSTNRFDGWDLAAARLGSLARALTVAGIPQNRVIIRGLDQESKSKAGQVLVVRIR